jgi:hypothetical protein
VRWRETFETRTSPRFEAFEMVELRLSRMETQADIAVSDAAAPEVRLPERGRRSSARRTGATRRCRTRPAAPAGVQPAAALSRLHAQGRRGGGVVIELGIDESGTVVFGGLVRSLGREFDAAVIDWARASASARPHEGPGPHALPDQAPRTLQAGFLRRTERMLISNARVYIILSSCVNERYGRHHDEDKRA